MWPSEIHPTLFAESSYVCMPGFRPVAPFFPFGGGGGGGGEEYLFSSF